MRIQKCKVKIDQESYIISFEELVGSTVFGLVSDDGVSHNVTKIKKIFLSEEQYLRLKSQILEENRDKVHILGTHGDNGDVA